MNREHVFPATVALSAHVVLLFGVSGAPRPEPLRAVEPLVRPIEVMVIVPSYPEEPLTVEPQAGGARSAPPEVPPPPRGMDHARVDPLLPDQPIHLRPPPVRPAHDGTFIPTGLEHWTNSGSGSGAGDAPGVGWLTVDALDDVPRATFQPAPIYPFEQRRMGIEGVATVTFTVDPRGRVTSATVDAADAAEFGEAALQAVSRWRFEPGRKDGRPVSFRMTVPLVFRLDG